MRTRAIQTVAKALLLSILVLSAIWLRVNDIGKFGFWYDEYFHVYAAKSLLTEGSLSIPFHGEYARAKPVTYITALSFRCLGESEASARLPFAAINVLFIIIGYVVLRHLFSERIALLFAILIAFSPFTIELARECRMYTAFQLAYFLMCVTFFLGFECDSRCSKAQLPGVVSRIEKRYRLSFVLLSISVLLFYVSSSLHSLSYNFALVVIGYCIILFLYEMIKEGPTRALGSKYAVALFSVTLFGIALYFLKRDFLVSMWEMSRQIPSWAWYGAKHPHYYRWQLQAEYPSLLFLYPVGAFCLIRKYGRKGVFFVISFVILIVAHSLWFGRVHNRYISYIFPFFVIGAAGAVEGFVLPVLSSAPAKMKLDSRWERVLFVVLAMPAICILLYPWFSHSRYVTASSKQPDWKSIPASLRREIRDAKVITTDPWAVKYYTGNDPEYYFIPEDERNFRFDYGSGVVDTFEQFRRILDADCEVFVLGRDFRFYNKAFLDDSMRQYVAQHMEKVDGPFDKRIVMYRKGFRDVSAPCPDEDDR